MLRKIKSKIREQLGITQILNNQDFISKQNAELLKANIFNSSITDCEWLKYKSFSPGSWAVDYAFLYTLFNILNVMHPKSILEFGLGQSSKLIHQYANFYEDVNAITCEHDSKWVAFFERITNLNYPINIKPMELANVTYQGEATLSYKDLIREFGTKQYDLIVVDGPFGSERYSRSQVLELAQTNLADTFCIMIDDYDREGEKETVRELMSILDRKNVGYLYTTYYGSKQHFLLCSENLKFLTSM
jgi:16S rRNA G966 N2-methylase RsmD